MLPDWVRGRLAESALARRWPGDGRTIVVIPGFLTTDRRTAMLRRVITRAGYRCFGWGLGRNGPIRADILDRLDAELATITARHPGRVTLIGWSLGGLIAREYAKFAPERVAAVITLGTPFSGSPHANRAWRVYEFLADHRVDSPPLGSDLAAKPPVPTIAIWSPRDGVIAAGAARGNPGERDAELRINCGHFAMSSAPEALAAVLATLARLARD